MKTTEYLDAAKAAAGLRSDYALAKRLGVTHQAISNYRCGRHTADHVTAGKLAELLELDPVRVIADIEIERATRPEQRRLWERIAAKVAAGVLVAVGAATIAPAPAGAHEGAAVYYVKRRRRPWLPLLPPLDPPDGLA